MNLPMFIAVIEGYQEHLFDLKCIAVYQGFWTGYYSNSKHPKNLSSILTSLQREHNKAKKRKKNKVAKPAVDVDVEQFLERERQFKAKLNK